MAGHDFKWIFDKPELIGRSFRQTSKAPNTETPKSPNLIESQLSFELTFIVEVEANYQTWNE